MRDLSENLLLPMLSLMSRAVVHLSRRDHQQPNLMARKQAKPNKDYHYWYTSLKYWVENH